LHAGGGTEVSSDEAGLAAGGDDLLDRLDAARRVAAVSQNLGPVPGQRQRDRYLTSLPSPAPAALLGCFESWLTLLLLRFVVSP
jgi:hypothetical protein